MLKFKIYVEGNWKHHILSKIVLHLQQDLNFRKIILNEELLIMGGEVRKHYDIDVL